MVRLKHKITEAPPPPSRGVKAATFKLLLDTAMALIQHDGHIPSVAEVAVRAAVSRATAYRYFATRSALITAVIDASLGPVRTIASDDASGRERVRELFVRTFPRFTEFEPQLRAAAQLSLEQGALEWPGCLRKSPTDAATASASWRTRSHPSRQNCRLPCATGCTGPCPSFMASSPTSS